MKNLFWAIVAILTTINVMAQSGGELESIDINFYPVQRNTIFAEANVLGALYSVNYDYIIVSRPSVKYSATVGGGITSFSDMHPLVALGLNASIGKTAHRVEVGAGITTVINETTVEGEPSLVTEGGTQVWQFTSDQHYTNMYATARVGYRYQRDTGGLFARAAFTPMLPVYTHGDKDIKLGGSIGIGYTFGAKKVQNTAPQNTF